MPTLLKEFKKIIELLNLTPLKKNRLNAKKK